MTSVVRRRLAVASIAVLALLATVTSIGSDFTYDDRGVVLDNPRVQSLSHLPRLWGETYWPPKYGGDGYRPFVLSLFALEWAADDGAPRLFHAVNVVLAVATALAIYWCASAMLPPLGAWIAAALFAVHPVHVEVTGNVVGQSELVVALCLCIALGMYVRRRRDGELGWPTTIAVALLYAVAIFTKEHAVVLLGLIVAAELTVIPGDSWRRRVRAARPLVLLLIAVTLANLYVRGLVQRDLTGFVAYPIFRFLRMTAGDRIGTMMNEMPRVAQLLVFPVHLSADYSPTDVIVANGFDVTEIPGAIICIGTLVLAVALRRRAPVASFGLLWLIVAYLPVSNLIVPAGFVMAERTLFLPSAGVVILVGSLAEHARTAWSGRTRTVSAVALAMLALWWLARSVDRQRVWKNNDTFFTALMRDAPNGYRAHFLYARHVGLKSRLSEMELEYRRAIRLFPYDAAMTLAVADAYTRAGLCKPAVILFEWSYGVEPEAQDARYQYVYCLAKLGRWNDVKRDGLIGLRYAWPRDGRLIREAVRQASLHLAEERSAGLRPP